MTTAADFAARAAHAFDWQLLEQLRAYGLLEVGDAEDAVRRAAVFTAARRAWADDVGPSTPPTGPPGVERLVDLRPGEQTLDGLLWHSRVTELAPEPGELLADLLPGEASEVAVAYGQPDERLLAGRGRAIPLLDGSGDWPPLVDEVAEQLGAVIV